MIDAFAAVFLSIAAIVAAVLFLLHWAHVFLTARPRSPWRRGAIALGIASGIAAYFGAFVAFATALCAGALFGGFAWAIFIDLRNAHRNRAQNMARHKAQARAVLAFFRGL